jgi:hypothetical protein
MDMWSDKVDLYGVMYETVKNALTFGIGWMELQYAKRTEETGDRKVLVGLDLIDSKTMDFERDTMGNIEYNEKGFPKGYIQYLPIEKEPSPGREVSVTTTSPSYAGPKAQEIYDDEVAYFTFESIGGSADGVGIVEPQYDLVREKRSIQKGYAQSIMRRGNPRYDITVGTDKYRPSPTERKNLKDEIENLKAEDDIVHENWAAIKTLEISDNSQGIDEILRFYVERQASCMGLPVSLVTGSGANTNRATLSDQKILLYQGGDAWKNRFARQFERQVIPYVMKNHDFEEAPKMVWEALNMDDRESKSLRLQRFSKSGLLTPDSGVELEIRKMENLPEDFKRDSIPEPEVKVGVA